MLPAAVTDGDTEVSLNKGHGELKQSLSGVNPFFFQIGLLRSGRPEAFPLEFRLHLQGLKKEKNNQNRQAPQLFP